MSASVSDFFFQHAFKTFLHVLQSQGPTVNHMFWSHNSNKIAVCVCSSGLPINACLHVSSIDFWLEEGPVAVDTSVFSSFPPPSCLPPSLLPRLSLHPSHSPTLSCCVLCVWSAGCGQQRTPPSAAAVDEMMLLYREWLNHFKPAVTWSLVIPMLFL